MADDKLEIKQQIDVIPATVLKEPLKLNWKVYEYLGCEISKWDDELDTPLYNKDDIREGDEIAVFAAGGWAIKMIVQAGCSSATNEKWTSGLEFAQDDRKCWVSAYVANLRGVAQIKMDI